MTLRVIGDRTRRLQRPAGEAEEAEEVWEPTAPARPARLRLSHCRPPLYESDGTIFGDTALCGDLAWKALKLSIADGGSASTPRTHAVLSFVDSPVL